MSIYTIKILGEANDVAPIVKKTNIVIKTKYNGLKMMDDASWSNWEKIFIFPDSEKAEYFAEHFNHTMNEYQEGMLKEDYIWHIIHCVYPEPQEIYADQLNMTKDLNLYLNKLL